MKPTGWALTDVGRRRDHNEDSFLCNDELRLYAVADGMGGHLGGERASRMAVELMETEMSRRLRLASPQAPPPEPGAPAAPPFNPSAIVTAMRQAVGEATRAIYQAAQDDPELDGMGTTLTSALFHEGGVTVCHVGDSRLYVLRRGAVSQLTDDHSWIAEQVRAGRVAADDLLALRFRNIITRSVGFEPTVEPDILTAPVEPGDRYVLCSDGLSNHLEPEDIARVLGTHEGSSATQALIDLANERGGEDNVTVIVIDPGL